MNKILGIVFTFFLVACTQEKSEQYLFKSLSTSSTGVTFNNTIIENDTLNILDFQYLYNGGGVGIGDFNNDGKPDLFFSGNQVSSALYLNKGGMKFTDITTSSGLSTTAWITGVSIVDINSDGWDDIYLSVGGIDCKNNCKNLLFINQKNNKDNIPTFQEDAKNYGLADGKYSQQTAFFDYDTDGDLDAFIIRNGNSTFSRNTPLPKNKFPEYLKDILLENKGIDSLGHPYFKDVSDIAGITERGFSLGIAISDVNGDQLPDIYVTNDFITNDVLYINQGKENDYAFAKAKKQLPSHTFNAMGVDISDLNNDQLPDITVVDMLPNDYERQKKMIGFNNYDKFLLAQRNDYTPQYVSNTLQLHNGMQGDNILPFSEIGHQSGIASTDWSWAPLVADYDNDGLKDLYITNGYVKDITDLDFINYSGTNNSFGTPEAKQKKLQGFVDALPGIFLPNYIFKNEGSASFTNVSSKWLAPENSFSNGAAYADLDQDGDLDLIVNNINAPAFILENISKGNSSNYVRIQLKGNKENKNALGSRVTLWQDGQAQTQYQSVIKGYLSSVEPMLHFGLITNKIDSLKVTWPDGSVTHQTNIKANQILRLEQSEGSREEININEKNTLLSPAYLLNHKVLENTANDFRAQTLLPHQFNNLSGVIAIANIDEKKGDEIFIGGNSKTPSVLFTESSDGHFIPLQSFEHSSDVSDAIFFDIDNDGDKDLYIAYGGTDARDLQDYVLVNTNGTFKKEETYLPSFVTNTTSVIPIDFDNDNDLDLFVTSGVQPRAYPKSMDSYLLRNDQGTFKILETFTHNGIIESAAITDKETSVFVLGEWQEVSKYTISDKGLKQIDITFTSKDGKILNTSGWWNTITAADMDNDGDDDLLLGNQGTNGFIKPSFNKPLYVYNQDFDKDGSVDPVLARYFGDTGTPILKPIHTRDDIVKQLVILKKRYGTYDAFAKADFKTLLSIQDLEKETLQTVTFESAYAENVGNNTYIITPLPAECQRSTINDFIIEDIDGDGYKDVLAVQNDLTAEANYGNYDAGIGIYLKGTKSGLKFIPNRESGFIVPGQSNSIKTFKNSAGKQFIITSQVNGEVLIFSPKENSSN